MRDAALPRRRDAAESLLPFAGAEGRAEKLVAMGKLSARPVSCNDFSSREALTAATKTLGELVNLLQQVPIP